MYILSVVFNPDFGMFHSLDSGLMMMNERYYSHFMEKKMFFFNQFSLSCLYQLLISIWEKISNILILFYFIYLLLLLFSHQHWLVVFYWSLSDSKSPQVFRTLSILADLNNAVWMVLIFPLISNFSSLSSKPFGTVPSAPITIGITVTLIFPQSQYLSIFFVFFYLWSTGTAKSTRL